MPGIGIITNPHSKLNKRDPSRQRLLGYIVGEHGKLELTNSLADLAKAAERFRDRGIEVLGINGGDGTISRTLTAFIRAYGDMPLPRVLILRGGTINVLAENLGIKGTPEAILVRYIESLSGVRPSHDDTFRILRVGNHYGFLFGNGMVANYLEEFYKNKTGPVGAVWLMIKICFWALVSRDRFRKLVGERFYQFKTNGNAIDLGERMSIAVMAATIEKMPLGPKFFPLTRQRADMFQFFSLGIPASSILWKLPFALLRTGEGQGWGRFSRIVSTLTVNTVNGSPQKYTLDGELFDSHDGKIEVTLGPMIQLIVV